MSRSRGQCKESVPGRLLAPEGSDERRAIVGSMTLQSRLATCLAAAIVVAPLSFASAAHVRLPHDLTLPATRADAARTARHTLETSQGAIGSGNEATADPPVAHPNETPCTDTLFSGATFAAYAPQTFPYVPPAGCPGPFAKIVFNGNFSVSAGVQFDRTASIEVGNVPIYFGTTAEPDSTLGPSWHVERDVTDDAALFASPQSAEADIFNIVNSTYTGVISGTAYLQFYPANHRTPPADTPDLVLPFPGVAGGPQQLPTGSSTLSATYTLPTNVDRAYLDVYAQSQQTDEQYFLCAPNDVASELFACGNGPLRETEISIDGAPAGVAPVYPWIFTGGLDPFLWSPIPGVQTLEFKPFRVDLTPFAGLLSNGNAHTVTLSVDNADNYFQGFATLFAYRDHAAARVTGKVTRDTLVANPAPTVVENLTGSSPSIVGTIGVTSDRHYEIDGYVDTPHGRVETHLDSRLDFANEQTYSNESDTTGTLVTNQNTSDLTSVVTTGPRGSFGIHREFVSFPLSVSLALVLDDTGTGTQVATIDQRFVEGTTNFGLYGGYASYSSNEVTPTDTLDILDGEFITGNANQSSRQKYSAFDTRGECYSQTVSAANNLVSAVSNAPCDRREAFRTLRPLVAR
jgi:Peptide N-acetyl-beta-D-glucosaminyl asparaginase amidase A